MTSRWRITIVAVILGAGLGTWGYFAFQGYQRARAQRADWQAMEDLRAPLERIVTMQFHEPVTLQEWASEFTRQTGLKVLAPEELVDPFGDRDTEKINAFTQNEEPLHWQFPPMPARVALDTSCELRSVRWVFSDDGVVLLYWQSNDEPRYAETYEIPSELRLQPTELQNFITRFIEPDEWEDVGGPWSMHVFPGSFITVQSYRGHRQTRQFLARLIAAQNQMPRGLPTGLDATDPRWEPIWLHGPQEQMRALQQALDKPIHLTAVNKPWPELVRALAEQAGLPIVQVDGDFVPVRVSCELPGVPLRETFAAIGFREQLTFAALAEGRMLAITSADNSNLDALLLFAYPISDFAHVKPNPASQQDLVDLISSSIDADSWQDVGGPGSIETIAQGELLLISQTLDNHRRIKDLLTGLRQLRGERLRSLVLEPEMKLPAVSPEIQARLRAPFELHYRETLVRDLLADLCERGDVSFPELEQTFSARLDQVWCHLPAAPLEDNLRLLFTACDFDLTELDHVSRTGASVLYWDPLDTQATELFDLRPRLVGSGQEWRVANLLELVFDPDSWDSVGGPGNIEQFREMLVVRNQPATVDHVRDFLAALNEHVKSSSPKVWRGQPLSGDALNRPLELYGASDATRTWREGFAAREAVLRQKLHQRVSVDLQEQTVGEAILAVAREHDLPIVIHAITRPFDPNDRLPTLKEGDLPLADVLQRLIGDPEAVVWRVQDGCLMVAAPQQVREPQARLLYAVDDLLLPRGPLLPGQLVRTIEQRLAKSEAKQDVPYSLRYNLSPGPHAEASLHLGNLLWLEATPAQPAQDIVEQILRDLRSGELQALPAQEGDLHYYHQPYPPYSTIPVVGSAPSAKSRWH
jgi:hypothetical protein